MTNWESRIGAFDWEACHDCEHSDPEEGGCALNDVEWRAKLHPEHDAVYCGAFEKRIDDSANARRDRQEEARK